MGAVSCEAHVNMTVTVTIEVNRFVIIDNSKLDDNDIVDMFGGGSMGR